MSNTNVKGKAVTLNVPAYALYGVFADMRNFVNNLPEEKKQGVEATQDTIEGEVQGMRMGAAISERRPFSCIKIREYGETPFHFEVSLNFDAIDMQQTSFHIDLDAELPFMIKMMIGNKLQEMIDKITDQLAMVLSGKVDMSNIDPETFAQNLKNV